MAPNTLADLPVPQIKRILRDCGVPPKEIFAAPGKNDLLELCHYHGIGPNAPDEWTMQKLKAEAEKAVLAVDMHRNPGAARVETSAGIKDAPDVKITAILPVGTWRLAEEEGQEQVVRRKKAAKGRTSTSPKGTRSPKNGKGRRGPPPAFLATSPDHSPSQQSRGSGGGHRPKSPPVATRPASASSPAVEHPNKDAMSVPTGVNPNTDPSTWAAQARAAAAMPGGVGGPSAPAQPLPPHFHGTSVTEAAPSRVAGQGGPVPYSRPEELLHAYSGATAFHDAAQEPQPQQSHQQSQPPAAQQQLSQPPAAPPQQQSRPQIQPQPGLQSRPQASAGLQPVESGGAADLGNSIGGSSATMPAPPRPSRVYAAAAAVESNGSRVTSQGGPSTYGRPEELLHAYSGATAFHDAAKRPVAASIHAAPMTVTTSPGGALHLPSASAEAGSMDADGENEASTVGRLLDEVDPHGPSLDDLRAALNAARTQRALPSPRAAKGKKGKKKRHGSHDFWA